MAALAAFGIGVVVDWVASKLPHWKPERAKRFFSALFIVIAFIVSLVIGLGRLIPDPSIETYVGIAADIPTDTKVMVGIAPAFYYHTGIAALSVPNEPIEIVLEAAERYDVTYLILDQNHPAPLHDIYTGNEQHPHVLLIETYDKDVKLYQFLLDEVASSSQLFNAALIISYLPSLSLPAFLSWVYPPPEAVIELQDYRTGYSIFRDGETGEILGPVPDAVCIELRASKLVEHTDANLELDDYLARSTLTVDSSVWTKSEPVLLFDKLGLVGFEGIDSYTGEIFDNVSNAGGPFTICWPIELNQGVHQIEFQSRTTSGEYFSFRWRFRISN
jgi:hypothetical protein